MVRHVLGSRRVFAIGLALVHGLAAHARADDGWLGKKVLTRSGTVLRVGNQVVDDERRSTNAALGSDSSEFRVYRVEQVNGPRLWLVVPGTGIRGWVEVEDVIPYGQAIDYFTGEICANPQNAVNYCRRGLTWSDREEFDKAIADYDEAIRIDPKYGNAYLGRGITWRAKKELDRAIADFGEAIRLDPGHAWPYFNRAVLEWERGRDEDAVRGARETIEKDGWKAELAPYATLLGHVAARRAGKDEEAKRFLDEAKAKGNTDWPAPIAAFFRGDLDAKGLLAAATDNDKQTEAHCFLGLDLALRGKPAEAVEHLSWVKEHGTKSFTEYEMALVELDRLERDRAAAGAGK